MAKVEDDQRPAAKAGARRFDPATFLATLLRAGLFPRTERETSSLRKATQLMQFSTSKKARSKSP
jgi:hypothetical protein